MAKNILATLPKPPKGYGGPMPPPPPAVPEAHRNPSRAPQAPQTPSIGGQMGGYPSPNPLTAPPPMSGGMQDPMAAEMSTAFARPYMPPVAGMGGYNMTSPLAGMGGYMPPVTGARKYVSSIHRRM